MFLNAGETGLVSRFREISHEIAIHSFPSGNRFKILLTIVPPKPSRDGEEVLNTLKEAGLPFFKTFVRRYKVFQKAALDGVLVKDVADRNAVEAWADYVQIVGEILK